VSGVNACPRSVITQVSSRLIGKEVPSGSRPRNSPGMSPSSQTERERYGSAPIPCTRIHAATLSPISTMVMTGVARVGLSSRIGNMGRI